MKRLAIITLLAAAVAAGQDPVSLEQAGSRAGADLNPALEGRSVRVEGQVASSPVWALGTYYVPLRDPSDHGLVMRGDLPRFAGLEAGDWIEAAGVIQTRGGLPVLDMASYRRLRDGVVPDSKDVTVAEAAGFRYLGLVIRTTGTVSGIGENLGGRSLDLSDGGATIAVFLPRPPAAKRVELGRVHAGDRVRITGLATQYSLEPPHNGGFQIMLAGPGEIEVLRTGSMFPLMSLWALGVAALGGWLWWMRARRQGDQRRSMRAFHALSEEIIAAASPAEIAEKLATVLPRITQATGVRLYLYQRRTKSLERAPTKAEPDPMAVEIDSAPAGLASGAAVCFRNRTLLNVPDVRRSPFVRADLKTNLPRSAMFVPLLSHHEVLGVLEVGNARRLGYFTVEEQAAAQHLANQVAASLKLQEQQTIREQLFRSEKLAATGQLISDVASELRAPLDSILKLATSLSAYNGREAPERELKMLAGESQRASEIVSRLVSFARPEDSAARLVDVNELIEGLVQFRDPEWKTLGIRVHNRLSAAPAMVLGSQGQIEQVFLNLLVHAEQCATEAAVKTMTVSSGAIANRLTVEISYPAPGKDEPPAADPFIEDRANGNGALGLGVCRGIVQGHGGEIRFDRNGTMARFEIDLPLARHSEPAPSTAPAKPVGPLTLMLVEPDTAAQRQLVALLSARGHRVVPAPMEQAADLAQRLRFDAALWAVRSGVSRTGESQERVRAHVPKFIVLSDAYDAELARSLEASGSFLLARPIKESEMDRMLASIEGKSPGAGAAAGRAGR